MSSWNVKEAVIKKKERQLKMMSDKDGEGFEVLIEDYENILAKFQTKDT